MRKRNNVTYQNQYGTAKKLEDLPKEAVIQEVRPDHRCDGKLKRTEWYTGKAILAYTTPDKRCIIVPLK